jgi:hypothetical protein
LKNLQTQLYNLQHKVSRLIKHRPFNTDDDDNDLEIAINQIQDHDIFNPLFDDDEDDEDDDDDDEDDDEFEEDDDDEFIDDNDEDDDIDIHINERIINHHHTHEIIIGDQVLNNFNSIIEFRGNILNTDDTQTEENRHLLADIFAFTLASTSFQYRGGRGGR